MASCVVKYNGRIGPYLAVFCLFFGVCFPLSGHAGGRTGTVHVFVALCDNENQGIVPVPEALGRGDDPRNNLYWGARYGVKTWFRKHPDWTLARTEALPGTNVLERCVFRHATAPVVLVADAYRGDQIREAIRDFSEAAAGRRVDAVSLDAARVPIGGSAGLVVYVGHNGLMDFSLPEPAGAPSGAGRDAVVLACRSRPDFEPRLRRAGARPLLLTTGFMAPEAYTLEAVVTGWLRGEPSGRIHQRAAAAYHRYQKCGLRGASRLFFSGPEPRKSPER